jgi:hypothetical protein
LFWKEAEITVLPYSQEKKAQAEDS